MMNWQKVLDLSAQGNLQPSQKITKSDSEWLSQLSADQFYVLRQKGTERPFLSAMCQLFEPGIYNCVGCDTELFKADSKFDSGTGWPSFTVPIEDNAVAYHSDSSHGMVRVEVTCNVCDSHLGHVFPDGPEPSGLRYCINAICLNKKQ